MVKIAKEIKFLSKEYDGDLTYIKRVAGVKSKRVIISAYAGKALVATALLKQRPGMKYELSFMVVHHKMRGIGLGSLMGKLAMRLCFDAGAKALYVMGECLEDDKDKPIPEHKSPVARYWKRLGFRRCTFKEYEALDEKYDDLDILPLKMGRRSKHVKALPSNGEVINQIVSGIQSIGKDRKVTTRADATVRIITPWFGEYRTDGKHSWLNTVKTDLPMSIAH